MSENYGKFVQGTLSKELDTVTSVDLAALLRTASTLVLIFHRFRLKPQASLMGAWSVKVPSKLPTNVESKPSVSRLV
jgi:hypothetical protein